MSNKMSVFEARQELDALVDDLDPVSRWMLVKTARRLRDGQEKYGCWEAGGRDYLQEAWEEAVDLGHYLLARINKDG